MRTWQVRYWYHIVLGTYFKWVHDTLALLVFRSKTVGEVVKVVTSDVSLQRLIDLLSCLFGELKGLVGLSPQRVLNNFSLITLLGGCHVNNWFGSRCFGSSGGSFWLRDFLHRFEGISGQEILISSAVAASFWVESFADTLQTYWPKSVPLRWGEIPIMILEHTNDFDFRRDMLVNTVNNVIVQNCRQS